MTTLGCPTAQESPVLSGLDDQVNRRNQALGATRWVRCARPSFATNSPPGAEVVVAGNQGGIVRAAPARRAGSASIASRNAMPNSASVKAEMAIVGDTNGPEVPSWCSATFRSRQMASTVSPVRLRQGLVA